MLKDKDPQIYEAICLEQKRQEEHLELIASENYVSKEVLEAAGSILTNKYAEGYPSKRYYGGCEYIDVVEELAKERLKKLFKAKYVNVQPHSGSQANMGAYRALLKNGDTVMGLALDHGGHLTHGHALSFSGQDYHFVPYYLNNDGMIDYDEVLQIAKSVKPKLIVTGASAYPRKIDFQRFSEIAKEVGAYLMVDMAHIAGLVAAGLHENPCLYADVVTSTTHKTLRGPRGGLILTNDLEIAKKIDKVIFPGIQGGPLMHVIGAKAQCFYEALQPDFVEYQKQVLKNIKALAKILSDNGLRIISGGTDNHLILVDVTSLGINGKEAEKLLDKAHITVNKNTIPNETLSAFKASGIRIGSPAMTTRGLKEKDFELIGEIIYNLLKNPKDAKVLKAETKRVLELTKKYPIK